MSEINTAVTDLAKDIKAKIKIDHKTGTSTVEGDVWEETLPKDLTKEQIKAVKSHEANFVAAATHAFGDLAVAAMKKNTDLEEASVTLGMYGHDKLSISTSRKEEYQNLRDPDAGPIVKHGATRVKYTVHAGKNAGELKKVLGEINELAEKALKK